MCNQVILVGRLMKDPEIIATKGGTKKIQITLAITRSFKNTDGIYEIDSIDIIIWGRIAENVSNYCKKGDVVGVRARLQTSEKDNTKKLEIIADKVTFLSSNTPIKQSMQEDEK